MHNHYWRRVAFMDDISDELNTSDYEYPNEIWNRKEDWEVSVKTAAVFPIVVLGAVGNVLLVTVILGNRHLRTPANFLIVNMAVTDFVTLVISPWMLLCRDFFQNYILGEFACKVEGYLEFSFLLTGVVTLVAVSYNRLLAIVQPHEARMSRKHAKFVMVGAWVFGFVVATPLIIYRTYKERQWANFLEIFCNEDRKVLPIYWNVIISLIIWVPLGVMLICYSAIFYKLDQYEKRVLRREHPISVNYKKRVAKTLFFVVVVFACCKVPFTAVVFRRSQLLQLEVPNTFGQDFAILWFTSHYLMFTNAALNPVIYGLTNDSFRKAFQTTPLSEWMFRNKKDLQKAWTDPRDKTIFTVKTKLRNVNSGIRGAAMQGAFKMKEEDALEKDRSVELFI